jgi:hypothetical protein
MINSLTWGLFYLIGLCWTVWLVEQAARKLELARAPTDHRHLFPLGGEVPPSRRTWNPLDPASQLYAPEPLVFGIMVLMALSLSSWFVVALGQRFPVSPLFAQVLQWVALGSTVLLMLSAAAVISPSRKLRHSLAMLAAYSVLFLLIYLAAHLRFGTSGEQYADELPAGGGSDAPQAMAVKVQKVVRKKYVINPYSSIVFAAPPPIENIDVKLKEDTANRYQVGSGDGGLGQGEGEGGGFGSGTGKGKINWYRLRHADKGWDKNFGIDGDRNLMTELEIRYPRMKGKIAEENKAIDCAELGRYSEKEPPYLVYIGGYSFSPSAADKKILKQYLLERHGMILGDSLGPGFGGGFQAAMTEITGVQPVTIPRDDPIHKHPFELPQLPFVVSHNGSAPIGWRVDGRWAVYWHPGALSDMWRSDKAGIQRKEIIASGYQLGLNIIAYALKEQDKWRQSRRP